jgi:hypothetical protein
MTTTDTNDALLDLRMAVVDILFRHTHDDEHDCPHCDAERILAIFGRYEDDYDEDSWSFLLNEIPERLEDAMNALCETDDPQDIEDIIGQCTQSLWKVNAILIEDELTASELENYGDREGKG